MASIWKSLGVRLCTPAVIYPAYLGGLPPYVDYNWLGSICHLWRNYKDIDDSFYSVLKIIEWFGDNMPDLRKYHGPGSWHDPDMLVIGNFGITPWQAKLQMSIWAILAAPLIMSNDLRHIDLESKQILTNRDAIGINQDPLGIAGYRIGSRNGFELWMRPLEGERIALCAFSVRSDGSPRPFKFFIEYIKEDVESHFPLKKWYTVKDVWKDHPNSTPPPKVVSPSEQTTVYLRPHSCVLWILTPVRSESDLDGVSYEIRAKVRNSL